MGRHARLVLIPRSLHHILSIERVSLRVGDMINPQALQWLRCPIDPTRQATLLDEETHLSCTRCRVRFRIRDGFPNMIADEAELPEGCANRKQLPCVHEAANRGRD
jgi:uncharacterized protein